MSGSGEGHLSEVRPERGPAIPAMLNATLIELDRWLRLRPDMKPLGQRVECVLKSVFAVPGSPVPALEPGAEQTRFLMERIREGWSAGAPAVAVVRPEIDRNQLIQRMIALAASTEHDHSPARRFGDLLRSNPVPIADWVCTRLMDGSVTLSPELEAAGIGAEYGHAVLRMSLLGELGDWSTRISVDLQESSWRYLGCPVCGAPPALAESRGLEQRRYLRCHRCGAGWPGHRMQCSFCGEVNPHRLRSYFAEHDQHRCRLVVCDGCGGRLKVVTTLAPLSPPGIIFAEFTMLYLDELDLGQIETRFDDD
jgi:FdhE protein